MPQSTLYYEGIKYDTSVALVYQVGIANLFIGPQQSDTGKVLKWTRVFQGSFQAAEMMAKGAGLAGAFVTTWHCDMAGDIASLEWQLGKGSLFIDAKGRE